MDAGADFFARLVALDAAPRQLAAFDRLFRQPPALPPNAFGPLLYQTLLQHLLEWIDAPRTEGGPHWEWRPLFQLEGETNPFYFTPDHIARRLEQCPPLLPEHTSLLVDVLTRFFDLRRSGNFNAVQATPLVNDHLAQRWQAIFPATDAWRAGSVLRALGLYAVGSVGGYRAYLRFTQGRFQPELSPTALIQWQSVCWKATGKDEGATTATTSAGLALPHQADFMAASFAGEMTALGLLGACLDVPQCDLCALSDACRWKAQAAERGPTTGGEVAALTRIGDLDAVPVEQLLQGLFDLTDTQREQVREALGHEPLRAWAGKSAQDLAAALAGVGLPPERLALVFELCRRFADERLAPGQMFKTAWDVFKHFRIRLRDAPQEQVAVVLLDVRKRLLGDRMVTLGVLDSSPAHPREVFAAAMRDRASSILLVHNHPSGDPTPSPDDIAITRQLVGAGKLVGIPLLDHVIIAGDRYVSLRDDRLVDF
ncbi:MAG TPA: JAB domain-containing protein [bacterium]